MPHRSNPGEGGGGGKVGDKYLQMLLFLGLLCIVLMETSFYYEPYRRIQTSAGSPGFCLLVRGIDLR